MNFDKKILLRNRSFQTLVITDVFIKFADSMDNVIVTLLVINLTASSTSTGILLAITTLPGILFSLIGGTLSDVQKRPAVGERADRVPAPRRPEAGRIWAE